MGMYPGRNHLSEDEYPNSVPGDVEVSVIMTAYNHEAYIAQAIHSVLMQKTNFAYELLIGEDASNDSTREICLQFAEQYPDKIRLFLRDGKNKTVLYGKVTGNKNSAALRESVRGKYIAILEGDDFWVDYLKLQKQYDFLEKHPEYELCGGVAMVVKADSAGVGSFPIPKYNWNGFIPKELIYNSLERVHTSTYFLRTEFRKTFPEWVAGILQTDLIVIIYACHKMGGIPYIHELMSVYRHTGSGIYSQRDKDLINQSVLESSAQIYNLGKITGDVLLENCFKTRAAIHARRLRISQTKNRFVRLLISVLDRTHSKLYRMKKKNLIRKFKMKIKKLN